MAGPAIDAVQRGVETLIQELRGNPAGAGDRVISVITFAKEAETGGAACGVISFQPPRLSVRTGTASVRPLMKLLDCLKE